VTRLAREEAELNVWLPKEMMSNLRKLAQKRNEAVESAVETAIQLLFVLEWENSFELENFPLVIEKDDEWTVIVDFNAGIESVFFKKPTDRYEVKCAVSKWDGSISIEQILLGAYLVVTDILTKKEIKRIESTVTEIIKEQTDLFEMYPKGLSWPKGKKPCKSNRKEA
jgi:hypothetical protein